MKKSPRSKAVKVETVSDGFGMEATRVTLDLTTATKSDWGKWAKAMQQHCSDVPAYSSLADEVEKRSQALEAQLTAIDTSAHPAIHQYIAEARAKLETARSLLQIHLEHKPAHIRDALAAAERLWIDATRLPTFTLGEKFRQGRKKGSFSPIRSAIAHLLRKQRELPVLKIWEMLAADPPRDHVFRDTPRTGKYIEVESSGRSVMEWRRFQNLVSEVRKELGI